MNELREFYLPADVAGKTSEYAALARYVLSGCARHESARSP